MPCAASGALVDPGRLDGNGVLWGNCATCQRPYVAAKPVEGPDGPWFLLDHEAHDGIDAEWRADIEAGRF